MGSCKKTDKHSEHCGNEHDPAQFKGLIGCLLRVYQTGDMITMDYCANRVNIETDADRKIVNITFG
jgi:hypothetical protein